MNRWVAKYRRGFHSALRDELDARGIDLLAVQGHPHGAEVGKQDELLIEWAEHVDSRVVRVGRREVSWMPVLRLVRDCDLVVVTQQSKELVNYALLARHLAGRQRLAFWGHGRNFDATGVSRVGEGIKRFTSRRVHWWFAYNELSARVVRDLGFPAERITDVQNAIDTRGLRARFRAVTDEEVRRLRARLGLVGDNVGLYIGGMYPPKRLPFLLDACERVRRSTPDFEMVFLGGGPDSDLVRAAAARHAWIRYVGPVFDDDKVPYFKLAKLLLMPGRVGLVILDSFALETPLVTVDFAGHAPEIDYLCDGMNGVMLPAGSGPVEYGEAVARLLHDDGLRAGLVEGARQAAGRYSIEEMARRFAEGVDAAVRAPRRGPVSPALRGGHHGRDDAGAAS